MVIIIFEKVKYLGHWYRRVIRHKLKRECFLNNAPPADFSIESEREFSEIGSVG